MEMSFHMNGKFKTMFKGAQCGAIFMLFYMLVEMLINPTHMVLLYEFNIPLLCLEVIAYGTVFAVTFIDLIFHVKKESNMKALSRGRFFLLLAFATFIIGINLWLHYH